MTLGTSKKPVPNSRNEVNPDEKSKRGAKKSLLKIKITFSTSLAECNQA